MRGRSPAAVRASRDQGLEGSGYRSWSRMTLGQLRIQQCLPWGECKRIRGSGSMDDSRE